MSTGEWERYVAEALGELKAKVECIDEKIDMVDDKLDRHIGMVDYNAEPRSRIREAATPAAAATGVVGLVEAVRALLG